MTTATTLMTTLLLMTTAKTNRVCGTDRCYCFIQFFSSFGPRRTNHFMHRWFNQSPKQHKVMVTGKSMGTEQKEYTTLQYGHVWSKLLRSGVSCSHLTVYRIECHRQSGRICVIQIYS